MKNYNLKTASSLILNNILNRSGSNWKVNKGTGPDEIALESEVKSKLGYSGSITSRKYCTKSKALSMNADSSYLTSYQSDQLVKYSSIVKKKVYQVTTDFLMYDLPVSTEGKTGVWDVIINGGQQSFSNTANQDGPDTCSLKIEGNYTTTKIFSNPLSITITDVSFPGLKSVKYVQYIRSSWTCTIVTDDWKDVATGVMTYSLPYTYSISMSTSGSLSDTTRFNVKINARWAAWD